MRQMSHHISLSGRIDGMDRVWKSLGRAMQRVISFSNPHTSGSKAKEPVKSGDVRVTLAKTDPSVTPGVAPAETRSY